MMKRFRGLLFGLLTTPAFFLMPCGVVAANTSAPSAEQVAYFERGRAMQRVVLILQEPVSLGIVALQPRFLKDIAAFEDLQRSSGTPADTVAKFDDLATVVKTGARERFPSGLSELNYVTYPDGAPKLTPQQRWLMELGMADVELRSSSISMIAGVSLHAMWVADHRADGGELSDIVPADAPPMPKAIDPKTIPPRDHGGSGSDLTAFRKYDADLERAIGARFPAAPYPHIEFGTGLQSDVRLGIAFATFAQLDDHRSLLAQTDSQLFVASVLDEAARGANPADGDVIQRLRTEAAKVDLFDPRSGSECPRCQLLAQLLLKMKNERSEAMVFGFFLAHVVYDALGDPNPERIGGDLEYIGRYSGLDQTYPWLAAGRQKLAAGRNGATSEVYAVARDLTLKLLQ
jgi:hypothetical protein